MTCRLEKRMRAMERKMLQLPLGVFETKNREKMGMVPITDKMMIRRV